MPFHEPELLEIIIVSEESLLSESLVALCKSGSPAVNAVCRNAHDALGLLTGGQFRLVVVDQEIGDCHYTEFIRRAFGRNPETRILVLSSRARGRNLSEVLRTGAHGFIDTSTTGRQFVQAIWRVAQGGTFIANALDLTGRLQGRALEMAAADPLESLSNREREIFDLLVEGYRCKEIASRLGISAKTVDTHRSNLMRKLEIFDLAGLVKYSVSRMGLYVKPIAQMGASVASAV